MHIIKPYHVKMWLPAVLLLTAIACNSQPKSKREHQLNWQRYNLKGKVKSITEFNYKEYVHESQLTSVEAKVNMVFDKAGNLVDQTVYLRQERFASHNTYKNDGAGNCTEMNDWQEDGSLDRKYFYQYDGAGNRINEKRFDGKGKLRSHETYTYDAYGNQLEWKKIGKSFSQNIKYKYTYDTLHRVIAADIADQITKDITTTQRILVKRYGDTVEQQFTSHLTQWQTVVAVDKNSRMIYHKAVGDPPGGRMELAYQYDSHGNCIAVDVIAGPEKPRRYEYVYDTKGSWVKRTITAPDGTPIASVERKIEYY